jgi:hypothetical protein
MTIRYKCEKCGSVLKIKDRLAGTPGNCPKCKTSFRVPEASSAEPPSQESADEEFSEEDAIFGKDFFTQQDVRARPMAVMPAPTADSDAEIDSSDTGPAQPPPAPAPAPVSVDNSAKIAGQLLSKTGKKNRPDDWQDQNDKSGGYDFSAVNYVILYRFAPLLLVGIALATGSYFLFNAGEGIDGPPLGEVTGIVKLDGKPTAAKLSFMPDNGRQVTNGGSSGSSSIGKAGEDGRYTVLYKADVKGAVIGKHKVLITIGHVRFVEEVEVKAGENPIDFDLTTPLPGQP